MQQKTKSNIWQVSWCLILYVYDSLVYQGLGKSKKGKRNMKTLQVVSYGDCGRTSGSHMERFGFLSVSH